MQQGKDMRRLLRLALAAGFASPALAQSTPGGAPMPSAEDLAKRDTVTFGVGGAIIPDYEGSNDYRWIPAAAISSALASAFIQARNRPTSWFAP